MTDQPPTGCRVEHRRGHDLDLVVAANDEVVLTFVPSQGGRLISCRFRGRELLWHDPDLLDDDLVPVRPPSSWPEPDGTMASWTNLGGNKTWPAPQGWDDDGQWHGPPDPVLDSGAYAVEAGVDAEGTATVELSSGADPTTGVQVVRGFRLPAAGGTFEQVSTFHNRSARPVTWSVWDVTQVDADPAYAHDGVVLVDTLSEPGPPEHLFAVEGEVTYAHGDGGWRIPSQDAVAKLGFPDATGALEWRRRDGVTLRLETSRQAGTYPDGGCPVELWFQHPLPGPVDALGGLEVTAYLVELEVLSPLTTLAPGEHVSLTTTWRLGGRSAPHASDEAVTS